MDLFPRGRGPIVESAWRSAAVVTVEGPRAVARIIKRSATNLVSFAKSLSLAKNTVEGYLDALTAVFLVLRYRRFTHTRTNERRNSHVSSWLILHSAQPNHWRRNENAEVDLVLEHATDRRIVGIEVKTARKSSASMFDRLRELRRAYPKQFSRGVMLHCGDHPLRYEDDLWSIPISALWTIGGRFSSEQRSFPRSPRLQPPW